MSYDLDLGGSVGGHHQDLCLHQPHHHGGGIWRNGPSSCSPDCFPRIYQIVEEINRRFVLDIQQKYSNVPGVDVQEKIRKMAIIYDGQVKMAHMAIVAGYSVNGVARLHTEILKKQELKDFYEMFPETLQ